MDNLYIFTAKLRIIYHTTKFEEPQRVKIL